MGRLRSSTPSASTGDVDQSCLATFIIDSHLIIPDAFAWIISITCGPLGRHPRRPAARRLKLHQIQTQNPHLLDARAPKCLRSRSQPRRPHPSHSKKWSSKLKQQLDLLDSVDSLHSRSSSVYAADLVDNPLHHLLSLNRPRSFFPGRRRTSRFVTQSPPHQQPRQSSPSLSLLVSRVWKIEQFPLSKKSRFDISSPPSAEATVEVVGGETYC